MWSRLPFELEDRLGAEKTLRVRRARYEGKSGRLIESVLDAVAPEHVDTNLNGKIPPRLNGHRGEGVNKVHGCIDRGLREPGEFREERIESLECPACGPPPLATSACNPRRGWPQRPARV